MNAVRLTRVVNKEVGPVLLLCTVHNCVLIHNNYMLITSQRYLELILCQNSFNVCVLARGHFRSSSCTPPPAPSFFLLSVLSSSLLPSHPFFPSFVARGGLGGRFGLAVPRTHVPPRVGRSTQRQMGVSAELDCVCFFGSSPFPLSSHPSRREGVGTLSMSHRLLPNHKRC